MDCSAKDIRYKNSRRITMFTGIVEEMGTVKKIQTISPQAITLTVGAKKV